MIARFTVLLPYTIHVRVPDDLQPVEGVLDHYRYRVHPPKQAGITLEQITRDIPLLAVIDHLVARDPVQPEALIQLDGAPTYDANLIQIDFIKEQFDRTKTQTAPTDPNKHGDPSGNLAFVVVNDFLRRFRALSGGAFIRELSSDDSFWRVQYLDDSGADLPEDPALFRKRFSTPFKEHIVGIDENFWKRLSQLATPYEPPIWDKLLLDADAALPDVGAAIVLTAAGIETLAAALNDSLAERAKVPQPLWEWITDRGFFLKDPSVEEQLDKLPSALGGQSLKARPDLWEAFKNIKEARNKCAHEGRPILGGTVLTVSATQELIAKANAIVSWAEEYLPQTLHRVRIPETRNWEIKRPITPAG